MVSRQPRRVPILLLPRNIELERETGQPLPQLVLRVEVLAAVGIDCCDGNVVRGAKHDDMNAAEHEELVGQLAPLG